METQDTEFSQLTKGIEIKGLFQVIFPDPGYNLLFGKLNKLFFKHELLSAQGKIHPSSV